MGLWGVQLWVWHLGELVDEVLVIAGLDRNVINEIAANGVLHGSIEGSVSSEFPWLFGLAVPSSDTIDDGIVGVNGVSVVAGDGNSGLSATLPSSFKEGFDSFVMTAVVVVAASAGVSFVHWLASNELNAGFFSHSNIAIINHFDESGWLSGSVVGLVGVVSWEVGVLEVADFTSLEGFNGCTGGGGVNFLGVIDGSNTSSDGLSDDGAVDSDLFSVTVSNFFSDSNTSGAIAVPKPGMSTEAGTSLLGLVVSSALESEGLIIGESDAASESGEWLLASGASVDKNTFFNMSLGVSGDSESTQRSAVCADGTSDGSIESDVFRDFDAASVLGNDSCGSQSGVGFAGDDGCAGSNSEGVGIGDGLSKGDVCDVTLFHAESASESGSTTNSNVGANTTVNDGDSTIVFNGGIGGVTDFFDFRGSIEADSETKDWDGFSTEVVGETSIIAKIQTIGGVEGGFSSKTGAVEDVVNDASLGSDQSD